MTRTDFTHADEKQALLAAEEPLFELCAFTDALMLAGIGLEESCKEEGFAIYTLARECQERARLVRGLLYSKKKEA